jgi:hypothetical protein
MPARAFIAILGALATLAGIVALFWTVYAYPYASTPTKGVGCGNAVAASYYDAEHAHRVDQLTGAMLADAGTAYSYSPTSADPVAECRSAITTQRVWAWPLFGIGLVTLIAAAAIRPRRPQYPPYYGPPPGQWAPQPPQPQRWG